MSMFGRPQVALPLPCTRASVFCTTGPYLPHLTSPSHYSVSQSVTHSFMITTASNPYCCARQPFIPQVLSLLSFLVSWRPSKSHRIEELFLHCNCNCWVICRRTLYVLPHPLPFLLSFTPRPSVASPYLSPPIPSHPIPSHPIPILSHPIPNLSLRVRSGSTSPPPTYTTPDHPTTPALFHSPRRRSAQLSSIHFSSVQSSPVHSSPVQFKLRQAPPQISRRFKLALSASVGPTSARTRVLISSHLSPRGSRSTQGPSWLLGGDTSPFEG